VASARDTVRAGEHAAVERFEEMVGGPARARVIVMLAIVLGLDSADKATVGAVGANLEHSLGIGNVELGLLVGVTSLMGAAGAIPAGILVDRVRRTRLLVVAIVVWSSAMIVSGLSVSFVMLLLTRLALGAVVAFAGPSVASLTGDFFPGSERGRIYGFILAGELVGATFGFLVAGEVAAALSWRYSFALLAVPGFVLAWAIWHHLPEPARGGQSHLQVGDQEIVPAEEVGEDAGRESSEDPAQLRGDDELQEEVKRRHIPPHRERILDEDPLGMRLRRAVAYVLSIRTNVILIVASALGYFFFGGLETFAVVFIRGHFGLGQGIATLLLGVIVVAGIAGAILGGRFADGLIHRGRLSGRILVPAVAYLAAAVIFAPGVSIAPLAIAILLYILGAMALTAPNPPLDAGRLDIMPARLWGRAEGVRTVLRNVAQAFAPVVFGVVSVALAAPQHNKAGATQGFGANASAEGLEYTFLIMLVPLIVSGLIMLRARRTYPRDVATAIASENRRRSA
jgi:MFS family permease